MWPFARYAPARRSSRHRPAGTLVLEPEAVTKDTYRHMLVTKVLPAIQACFPAGTSTVVIQQDNAKPHLSIDDPQFIEAAERLGGRTVKLDFQPSQSPDLNVLDLGFFSAIQTLQFKQPAANLLQMLRNVEGAFTELTRETLDATFLSLQKCMECAIAVDGGSNYKLPHTHKQTLARAGLLPRTLQCDPAIYDAGCLALGCCPLPRV